MSDMVETYCAERHLRAAGQQCETLPWWPEGIVAWDQAVFRVSQAVFGEVDWGQHRRSDARLRGLLERCSERIEKLTASGECWPASAKIVQLQRVQAAAWRRRIRLWKVVAAWIPRHEAIASLLKKMGELGKIPGALVLTLEGTEHVPAEQAWTCEENWLQQKRDKLFSPGDAPLAPRGTLCLPEKLVDAWCVTLRDQPNLTLEIASAKLLMAKREDQSWKEFAAEHPWAPKLNGQIGRHEALRLAKLAKPWADREELRRTARTIETSVNR